MKKSIFLLFHYSLFILPIACKNNEEPLPSKIKSNAQFFVHVSDSLTSQAIANASYYLVGVNGKLKTLNPLNYTDIAGNFSFVLERNDDIRNYSHGIFNEFYITVIKDSLYGRLVIPGFYNYNATPKANVYSYEIKLSKPTILKLRVKDDPIVKYLDIIFTDSLISGERFLHFVKPHHTILDTIMYFRTFKNNRNPVKYTWIDTLDHSIGTNYFYLLTNTEDTTFLDIIY